MFEELAKKHGKSIPQILIRWSLQHGYAVLARFVESQSSPVLISSWFRRLSPQPKSSHAERIQENAQVYDFTLSEAEMARIDALDKGDDGACQWNPIHAA